MLTNGAVIYLLIEMLKHNWVYLNSGGTVAFDDKNTAQYSSVRLITERNRDFMMMNFRLIEPKDSPLLHLERGGDRLVPEILQLDK